MGLRSCNIHFINSIRGNQIIKQRNVDIFGKPSLLFRAVGDILEKEDASQLQPAIRSLDTNRDTIEKKLNIVPQVDRSLQESDSKWNIIACQRADNEMDSNSDEDSSGEMTLKQLKEKRNIKKRKHATSTGVNTQQSTVKVEPAEYDSDLQTPLICLKTKPTKAKKKRITAADKPPRIGVTIDSEKDPESRIKLHVDSTYLHHIKTEAPELSEAPFSDDVMTSNLKEETTAAEVISDKSLEATGCKNKAISSSEEYGHCMLNLISYYHLEDVEPSDQTIQTTKVTSDAKLDEKSCHHLCLSSTLQSEGKELVELNPNLISPAEDLSSEIIEGSSSSVHLHELMGKSCNSTLATGVSDLTVDNCISRKEFTLGCDTKLLKNSVTSDLSLDQKLNAPTSTSKGFSSSGDDFSEITEGSSSSVHLHELIKKSCNSTPATGVSDLTVDNCISFKEFSFASDTSLLENSVTADFSLDQQIDAPTSPARGFCSSECDYPCTSTDDRLFSFKDNTIEQMQSLACISVKGVANCLDNGIHSVLSEEKCSFNDEVDTGVAEGRSSSRKCSDNKDSSALVPAPPPERLLLTRKVVSPTSEERISLTMSSKELLDQNGNFCPGKKAENEALSVAETHEDSASVNQKRGIASVSILKKSGRRNPLPKSNLEHPRRPNSLRNLSTGCTSLQRCSESAIAFSQRQMQDFESLAMKLTSELKSMKDIMEGRLLFEAHQTSTLKSEAEEVSKAIKSATKMEELTKKWLSMMGRDCNRFCKIMSLKQKETAGANVTTNNVAQRETKKIAFADEAGGQLTHVKFFGNDMKPKDDPQ